MDDDAITRLASLALPAARGQFGGADPSNVSTGGRFHPEPLDKGEARGGRYYRRTPTGNPKRPWRYFYTKEEYDREHGSKAHVAGPEAAEAALARKGGEVKLTKQQLAHRLKHGTYSIISAGRNPAVEDEAKLPPDHAKFAARHAELRKELTKRGHKFTEVEGHYGGKEKSFLVYHEDAPKKPSGEKAVMVHHDSPSEFAGIRALGKKFNQDSIIHSHAGKHELHYTTGVHTGDFHRGEGHKIVPHAEDFYTHAPTKRGATKFTLHFQWDKYHHPDDREGSMFKSVRFVIPMRLFRRRR